MTRVTELAGFLVGGFFASSQSGSETRSWQFLLVSVLSCCLWALPALFLLAQGLGSEALVCFNGSYPPRRVSAQEQRGGVTLNPSSLRGADSFPALSCPSPREAP